MDIEVAVAFAVVPIAGAESFATAPFAADAADLFEPFTAIIL